VRCVRCVRLNGNWALLYERGTIESRSNHNLLIASLVENRKSFIARLYLRPTAEGDPSEFCHNIWCERTIVVPGGKKFDNVNSCSECNERTRPYKTLASRGNTLWRLRDKGRYDVLCSITTV